MSKSDLLQQQEYRTQAQHEKTLAINKLSVGKM